jgi:hypothetical protein
VAAGSASASGPGSALDALRVSAAAGQISTVDNADTVIGQIVTVQALAKALAGGKASSYGWQPGDTAPGPSPAPTPSGSAPARSAGSPGQNARTAASASPAGKA